FGINISRKEPVSLEKILPAMTHRTQVDWPRALAERPVKLSRRFGQSRTDVQYVLGVPTVYRSEKNYLIETLYKLIDNMHHLHRHNCLIVVYIGETSPLVVQEIWQSLKKSFLQHLEDGLIDVIAPPVNYYANMESLAITLHDTPERVRWRTKQTLDYMYLMNYAQSRGSYYLQLEDDIDPSAGYFEYIYKLTEMHTNFRLNDQRSWIALSFCDLGFIGKLVHTAELKPFLAYVQIFYNDQPIDWLLQAYVKLRCCRWDSFQTTDCAREYFLCFIHADQSQFQHKGLKSSLRDKKQQLKDKKFTKDLAQQRMRHLRQPLNLVASHKRKTLRHQLNLELGESFFWGYMPQVSSLMRYMLNHQFDSAHFVLRNGPKNGENFTELSIDLKPEVPAFAANSSEAQQCGFILSYIAGGGSYPPNVLYFYIREQAGLNGIDEINWFRRFLWSNTAVQSTSKWSVFICIFIWNL
ncbi:hypothetical protein KR222_008965, partial [Zaprionus bogoriensis]